MEFWNVDGMGGRSEGDCFFFPDVCILYAYVTELKSACCFPQRWEFFTFLSFYQFFSYQCRARSEDCLPSYCARDQGRGVSFWFLP